MPEILSGALDVCRAAANRNRRCGFLGPTGQRCDAFFNAQITVIRARSASEWVCGDAPGPTRLRFVLVSVGENASQRCLPGRAAQPAVPGPAGG
jgi:hypothetical protein